MLTDLPRGAIVSLLLMGSLLSVVGATGPGVHSPGPWRFSGGNHLKVERLSASSIDTFEGCEARFHATYVEKGPEISGDAAIGGTVAHETLEEVITSGIHNDMATFTLKAILAIYNKHADRYGLNKKQISDGHGMMKNWHEYHMLYGFEKILSTEVKTTFTLTHPTLGSIPVTYIFDRADWLAALNSLKIVDYKSFASPMAVDELTRKVQVRIYALAGAIEYKELAPAAIWVEYWLLRYGPIAVAFSRDDNMATWRYLQDVWERIDASDGQKETVNSGCRWCIRKTSCDALKRHVNAGGVLGLGAERVAEELSDTKNRISALNGLKTELEDALSDFLDEQGTTEHVFESGTQVFLKPSGRREIDGATAAAILGPELVTRYGTIGVTILDKILKDEPDLTADQRKKLTALIKKKNGATMTVKVPSVLDDIS